MKKIILLMLVSVWGSALWAGTIQDQNKEGRPPGFR
jgi:hypothetical protein